MMSESNPSKRGLEQISHLFLSGAGPKEVRAESPAAQLRPQNPPPEPCPDREAPGDPGPVDLRAAVEVDSSEVSTSALLRAVETYLRRFNTYRDASVVDNVTSPDFGASDLLLVDRSRGRIVCARMTRGQDTSGFVVSSLAYYDWLRRCLEVGALFSDAAPTLDLYVFAQDFPASITSLTHRWSDRDRVHPIAYKLWRVEGLKRPAVHFKPVGPSRPCRAALQPGSESSPKPPRRRPARARDPFEITHDQWQAFERLKQDAFCD